ncbi:MAG TPA: hypothetical protein VGC00_02510, partial [Thermoanaerobaculia bacterium]
YLEQANRLDPLDSNAQRYLGIQLGHLRRYDEAIHHLLEANRLAPAGESPGDWTLGRLYPYVGRATEAVKIAELRVERSHASPTALRNWRLLLGWAYARAGRSEQGRQLLTELESGAGSLTVQYLMAVVAAALGEHERALRHLEIWYAEDPSGLPGDLDWEWWDPLRSEPRFQALEAKVKRRMEEKLAAAAP